MLRVERGLLNIRYSRVIEEILALPSCFVPERLDESSGPTNRVPLSPHPAQRRKAKLR
jgi:hypothetical protein